MMTRRLLSLACVLIAGPAIGQLPAERIVIGELAEVESRILGESREIFVGMPQSYDADDRAYGVLYVLDGETQFQHTLTTTRFLGGGFVQKIPPLLVVAIGNTDRMRDLTPPSEQSGRIDAFVAQGGAEQFLRFIEEELRPWVEDRYRTNGYDVLIGHSLGGLFALHTFVTSPASFDGYIALDPSLWWDDQALVRNAGLSVAGSAGLTASVYIAVSGAESQEHEPVHKFADVLQSAAPSGVRWLLVPIAGETHDTLSLPGIYEGLQWVFADWDIEEQAQALYGDAHGEQILASIDELYRSSGERFSTQRETPYFVFESLLSYLAMNDRLDEAAELTLRYSDRYPLPMVPNVISGIAGMYVERGNSAAAMQYLNAVLERFPQNDTALRVLDEIDGE